MIKYIICTSIGIFFSLIRTPAQLTNSADDPSVPLTETNYLKGSTNEQPVSTLSSGSAGVGGTNTTRKSKLNGNWQTRYANQRVCDSGWLQKGLPDGEWKHWSEEGTLLAIRNYNAEKLQRIKYEIKIDHPKNTGYLLTRIHKKNPWHANRLMHAGNSFEVTTFNGYRPVFDECLHHGLYMNFYADASVKDSGYYKNGLRESLWMQRERSGSYYLGMYRHGVKEGDWKYYDQNGKMIGFILYKKGKEAYRKNMRN